MGSEREAKQSQIVENWKDEVDCDSNNVVAQLEEAKRAQRGAGRHRVEAVGALGEVG